MTMTQVQNWYNGTVHCPGVASTTRGVANGELVQMQSKDTRFKSTSRKKAEIAARSKGWRTRKGLTHCKECFEEAAND